jgi:hypothetical protein
MKRITYSGGSLVTGNAITVLEDNGETSVHTLLLSPASQFDVADAGGISEDQEAERFPVPDLPQVGIVGSVDSSDAGAEDTANDVNAMMNDIDHGLGH